MIPFWKSLAFWSAVSWIGAGVVGLLVYFGKLSEVYAYSAPVILAAIQAIFQFLKIELELRAKGLL